jgi:hypothetical protein
MVEIPDYNSGRNGCSIWLSCDDQCALFAESLVRIIVRHHKWHAWFIKKYVAVPGNIQKVYPGKIEEPAAKIADMDAGYIAGIIRTVGWLLDAGWIVAAVVLLAVK